MKFANGGHYNALQCIVIFVMQVPKERKLQFFLLFSNVFVNFSLMKQQKKALCDLEAYQLHGQMVSEASKVYRFQKMPKRILPGYALNFIR